jgi:hypothetical protein
VFKHASTGQITESHVMTTDVDFFPLFEALQQTRAISFLHCFPSETSDELMYLADRVVPVNPFRVLHWCGMNFGDYIDINVPHNPETMVHVVKSGRIKGGFFKLLRTEDASSKFFYGQMQNWNSYNVWKADCEMNVIYAVESLLGEKIIF